MSAARIAGILALAGVAAGLGACAPFANLARCGRGCPGDAQLNAEVRQRLDQHVELLAPNHVYVRTLDRVVYLTGEVATDLQRETAESIARETPGVPRVVDLISLEYEGR